MQNLERPFVAGDMELIAGAALERAAAVCPDLGIDAERPQQAECAPRNRRIGDVEMDRHLTAPPQVDASGRMEEPRELRETVALTPRRDRRELVPEVVRK